MDSKLIGGRTVFNSALPALLAVAILLTGCAPLVIKAPKAEAVTSAAAPASAPGAAAPAPAAAAPAPEVAAPAAPEENPLSDIWQRLISLENVKGNYGFIAITDIVVEKNQGVPGRFEVGMVITSQLRKPAAEVVIHFDAHPARIAGIEASEVADIKAAEVFATTSLSKGRAGWRLQPADGQVPLVSQKLRLHMEAPQGAESVELRIQRVFKKANGDLLNFNAPKPDNLEAHHLLDDIDKELSRRANGVGSDVPWFGVVDCASIKGEQKEGKCYPTGASWSLARQRAAGLGSIEWLEKVMLPAGGGSAVGKKEEPVKPQPAAETPKPAEAVKPVEASKPAEAEEVVEAPKPAEAAKAVEAPKPAEASKAVEAPKPAEAAKAVVAPKPAAAAKPVVAPKPAKAAKSKPEPAKPAAKKDEPKKKVNESGQPIYDLSDVLGKQ